MSRIDTQHVRRTRRAQNVADAVVSAYIHEIAPRQRDHNGRRAPELRMARRAGAWVAALSADEHREADQREEQPVPALYPQRRFGPEAAPQRLERPACL